MLTIDCITAVLKYIVYRVERFEKKIVFKHYFFTEVLCRLFFIELPSNVRRRI